mmetsp:Transcript_25625/g.48531  ORF Transcript_25625/g.48531 Transcript_25625/m.48531 type:complete len:151 (+) Transcript_25625:101-553(+)
MVQRQESTRTAKQWECRMMMCVSLHAHVVDVDDDAIRHLKQPNGPGGWDDEWWLPHIPSVCVGRKNRRWFPPKKGDRKNRFIAPAGEHACARLPAALARENTFLELLKKICIFVFVSSSLHPFFVGGSTMDLSTITSIISLINAMDSTMM